MKPISVLASDVQVNGNEELGLSGSYLYGDHTWEHECQEDIFDSNDLSQWELLNSCTSLNYNYGQGGKFVNLNIHFYSLYLGCVEACITPLLPSTIDTTGSLTYGLIRWMDPSSTFYHILFTAAGCND